MSTISDEILVEPTKKELTVLKSYLSKQARNQIKDIKLVKKSGMKENEWSFLAVRFKNNDVDSLISAVVDIRADTYAGIKEGYHLFWFD